MKRLAILVATAALIAAPVFAAKADINDIKIGNKSQSSQTTTTSKGTKAKKHQKATQSISGRPQTLVFKIGR